LFGGYWGVVGWMVGEKTGDTGVLLGSFLYIYFSIRKRRRVVYLVRGYGNHGGILRGIYPFPHIQTTD
jgi:hypothetical protein